MTSIEAQAVLLALFAIVVALTFIVATVWMKYVVLFVGVALAVAVLVNAF